MIDAGPTSPEVAKLLRTWELGVALALLGLVAFIFLVTLLAPPLSSVPEPAGGMDFQLQARYVLGTDALLGGLAEKMATGPLLEQLRGIAETPAAGLCLVTVVAEVQGFEAALGEIELLGQEGGDELAEDVAADLALLRRIYSRSPEAIGPEERAALVERRDWFGRLALSHAGGDGEAHRGPVLAAAKRTAAVLMAAGGSVIFLGLAGLALLATAVARLRDGNLRSGYSSFSDDSGLARRIPYFETLVAFLLVTLGLGLVGGLLQEAVGQTVALAINLLALPVVLWPLLRGAGFAELCRACGWHRGTGFWREVAAGLVGYVAGLPVLLAALLVSGILARFVEAPPSHPLVEGLAEAGWAEIAVIYVLACVWAPLVEETIFRGGFYHYLRGRFRSLGGGGGVAAAALVSSLVFAMIHPQGILGVPPLVALAVILALIREWRGSLVGSVTVHAVHNGATTTLLLLLLG